MITLRELNPKGFPTNASIRANLADLYVRINLIRQVWGKPMIVTSGLRSIDDHKRIYLEMAKKQKLKEIRIPMGSKHLSGQAVDIMDRDGSLYKWCQSNDALLEEAGLYCEIGTKGWVHFQSVAPKSGKRWFKA